MNRKSWFNVPFIFVSLNIQIFETYDRNLLKTALMPDF